MSAEPKGPAVQVVDRRFWVRDEAAIEQAKVLEKKYPSFVEELKARTERAEETLKEKVAQLDVENAAFRARMQQEIERRVEADRARTVGEFLEILDNLEKALASHSDPSALRRGLELTVELFLKKLAAQGFEPIRPIGQPFDPATSEALSVESVQTEAQDNTVLEVLTTGFILNGKLVRPAQVRVGRKP
ncbi:MAG: nucleotide exchange factor GrpE [Acidobacteriota bacterium]